MSTARRQLAWAIKKNLYKMSVSNVYQVALNIDSPGTSDLQSSDEEGCVDFILNYMQSDYLLNSEDEGMSQLLMLNDMDRAMERKFICVRKKKS
ncbi:uncharacterized protein V6R79_008774 [Siganus canaliculatus]